ncbi:MAG: diaminopimelate decarboxylase [Gemmatimonadetes bacterium]|nr:diaminopimelate decarboxylase [Gemmatimonadota bacterium]
MGAGVLSSAGVVRFAYRDGHLHCEDVPAEELARKFGTPLYVYSHGTIVERYRAFAAAFAPVRPLIAYSVKANGNLAVLRALGLEGAGADIVSGGELHRALLAGIPADRIVFSGVGKSTAEMRAGLAAGVYGFNVESEGELRDLAAVARETGIAAPIAIRVNPDIEAATPHHYTRTGHLATKFGVPWAEAHGLYRQAAALPGILVRGIDVHIGSQILDPEPYRAALRRVLELAAQLADEGIALEYVDAGGGYGVAYEDGVEPAASEFADALLPDLIPSGLRVVLEPGRYIVGPAGVLLTRVLFVKEMGRKTFVITDAGMNDLLRPSHYASYHRIDPVIRQDGRPEEKVDIVGPVCESGDFLALDRVIPRPRPGELLAIGTVGAYGFTMASTYNSRPRPAEVMVAGALAFLARRRETIEDLVRGEIDAAEDAATAR